MSSHKILNSAVVVGALGYFVDIYDLILFSIVRVQSLRSIGVPEAEIMDSGIFLLNAQMIGMLLGGLIWGVLGDKRGRVSVLFGSIAMYSLANLANAFVTSVPAYAALRFIAGIGLAGELGAAITLVAETLPKETRGYGTAIVAAVGILGAVAAALVGEVFSWQTAFIIGGVLGLALLVTRYQLLDSGLFDSIRHAAHVRKGDLRLFFKDRQTLLKYLCCILIGMPLWYVIGILVTFSPELAKELGTDGVLAGRAVMWSYLGLAVGDMASGILSQWLKSRRKVVAISLLMLVAGVLFYVFVPGLSPNAFYGLCAALGFAAGYWAMFVTIASEQFGTNLRATATTTVPNFVRGSVLPLTLSFRWLADYMSLPHAALVVGMACLGIAFLALTRLSETYGRDLNFLEGSERTR